MHYPLWFRNGDNHMVSRVAALVLSLTMATSAAVAQGVPTLFKIVTPKDEVVIATSGIDLDAFAKRLVADGQITVWQYAVRKAANGDLEQAPLRRIAILRQDTLRIEPFASPLRVAPLPP
jgi:hypothetical protein